MKCFFIIISLFGGLLQAQCDDLLESQCTSSSVCEWVITDTENYNCANFGNQSSCEIIQIMDVVGNLVGEDGKIMEAAA